MWHDKTWNVGIEKCELTKLDLEDIKVGDVIAYPERNLTYGGFTFYLCSYLEVREVERITPKRTKIEFKGGTSISTKYMSFYVATPEVHKLRVRARFVKQVADRLYAFIQGYMPPSDKRNKIINGIRDYVLNKTNDELEEVRKAFEVLDRYVDGIARCVEQKELDRK